MGAQKEQKFGAKEVVERQTHDNWSNGLVLVVCRVSHKQNYKQRITASIRYKMSHAVSIILQMRTNVNDTATSSRRDR